METRLLPTDTKLSLGVSLIRQVFYNLTRSFPSIKLELHGEHLHLRPHTELLRRHKVSNTITIINLELRYNVGFLGSTAPPSAAASPYYPQPTTPQPQHQPPPAAVTPQQHPAAVGYWGSSPPAATQHPPPAVTPSGALPQSADPYYVASSLPAPVPATGHPQQTAVNYPISSFPKVC